MVYMSSIREKIATFLFRKATVMHCDSVPLVRREGNLPMCLHSKKLVNTHS